MKKRTLSLLLCVLLLLTALPAGALADTEELPPEEAGAAQEEVAADSDTEVDLTEIANRAETIGEGGQPGDTDTPFEPDKVPENYPQISLQPQDAAAVSGKKATFTVKATQAKKYQWQVSKDGETWQNVPKATKNKLSVKAEKAVDGNLYRCVISNADGSVNSTAATLTVTLVLPTVLVQPANQNVRNTKKAAFSVKAKNAKKYQWQVSTDGETWTDIPKATKNKYAFTATEDMDGNQYRCILSNADGEVETGAATLSVYLVYPTVVTNPTDQSVRNGKKATFTVKGDKETKKYQWQVSTDGETWTNIPKATKNKYAFTAAESMNNNQYRCILMNADGKTESASATLTVGKVLPQVVTEPQDAKVKQGGTATFTVKGDKETKKYQWQVSTDGVTWKDIPKATKNKLAVKKVTAADHNQQYRCVLSNADGSVESSPAVLVITDLPAAVELGEVELTKSSFFNPLVENMYGGDPAVLVDGDTVYLYIGQDSPAIGYAGYLMPRYQCYSSKDLMTWNYEGVAMDVRAGAVSWAKNLNAAWASQVEKYNNQYYLYFCTWDNTDGGRQSIGVAVSDSPTGPFVDIGHPLVKGSKTTPQAATHDDIDPTVWVEKDDEGVEHRYLAWGNTNFFICELNEDMISVKDLNHDGSITCGEIGSGADIIHQQTGLHLYTEAPWLYRRTDRNGNPTGKYYLFYAYGWREGMAVATTDSLMDGTWTFDKMIMPATATSNTNHMAVFDFDGKTYIVYHNGSRPGGDGFHRSPCLAELKFSSNGSVQAVTETAAGPFGQTVTIRHGGAKLAHKLAATNPAADAYYPLKGALTTKSVATAASSQWVLCPGKADASKGAYVSIQSENKPGLYITAEADGSVILRQDTDGTAATAQAQTFRSVQGLNGTAAIAFESVSQPGMYLSVVNNALTLTDGSNPALCVFTIQ